MGALNGFSHFQPFWRSGGKNKLVQSASWHDLAACIVFCHLPAFVVGFVLGETSLLAFLSVIMESWTVALERRLLELWFEAKTRYETTMKRNTRKRAWILDELKKCAGEGGREVPQWLVELTDKKLKNKIEYLKVRFTCLCQVQIME